jgi:hypothetical protein
MADVGTLTTPEGETVFKETAIEVLAHAFATQILTPGCARYDEARAIWNESRGKTFWRVGS